MFTYRKTRDGEWVIFATREAAIEARNAYHASMTVDGEGDYAEDDKDFPVTVTLKSGETKRVFVADRIGNGFDIDGTLHVYLHII